MKTLRTGAPGQAPLPYVIPRLCSDNNPFFKGIAPSLVWVETAHRASRSGW